MQWIASSCYERWLPTHYIYFPTSYPTSNSLQPMHPIICHPLVLPYSFFSVPHNTLQSVCCLIPWIRAKLHLNTEKSVVRVKCSRECSLAQAVLQSSWQLQPHWQLQKRVWRAWVHTDPTFTTKDAAGNHINQSGSTKENPEGPHLQLFFLLCGFQTLWILGALQRIDGMENIFKSFSIFFFKQEKHVSACLEHILYAMKNSPQLIIYPGTGTMITNHNSRSFLKASVGEQFSYQYIH